MMNMSTELVNSQHRLSMFDTVDLLIKVYSGARPCNPNNEPTGTLLATGLMTDCKFLVIDGKLENLFPTDICLDVVDSGTIGWYRIYPVKGELRFGSCDGCIGHAPSSDLLCSNLVVYAGDKFHIRPIN